MAQFFDFDAHLEESNETWKYLDKRFQDRCPMVVNLEDRHHQLGQNAVWLIDGNIVPRMIGRYMQLFGTPTNSRLARSKTVSIGSQELTNVEERLADLDRYGIEYQVVNSTLFGAQLTPDIELEMELIKAYNTWISEVCSRSKGRLRWTAVIKLRNVEKAVTELRRVSELGAAAVRFDGIQGDSTVEGHEFDPFWAEAERLNMPIYVHVGFYSPALGSIFRTLFTTVALVPRFAAMIGFVAIVGGGIAERFPRLRFAFVEAGSEWVPWLVNVLEGNWRLSRSHAYVGSAYGLATVNPREIVRRGNIIVACEAGDNLRDVLEVLGEDQIVLGSDMPHVESHPDSFKVLSARTDINKNAKEKILRENALRFFSV
jgi:predicted TIM-barrel fold metal-dependent hydrolase